MHLPAATVGILLMLLTGCATIIDGGDKSVRFNSSPDGAKVTIYNQRNGEAYVTGNTPAVFTLKRKSGYFQNARYHVVIEKNGFRTYEFDFRSVFNAWYLGNLVFGGGIGILIVDPWTGALWTFRPGDYKAPLTPSEESGVDHSFESVTEN